VGSLIEELQAQALDRSVPVDDLLLKAKVVAEKLDIPELREWVNRELNGYGQNDQFPEYRKVQGDLQAFNPYHGWQPIIFPEPGKVKWLFEPRIVNSPAGQLEGAKDDVEFSFNIEPSLKAQLIQALEYPCEVRCLLNRSQILAIPGHVRSKILDWSLRLEKAGIRGEGLSFSQHEKERAHYVSISIHGNVENLSNVVDVAQGAHVTTQQTSKAIIDVSGLAALAADLRQHVDSVIAPDRREQFHREIEVIESESQTETPNPGRLRRALTAVQAMVRDAAVSAGSSLIVQGALALINEALKRVN
jgi:hypothetical protein